MVTAQKRSESLQDVPVAVSAYTSETRDLLGITTIGDLTDFTPGLSYATSLDRMSLRGVGRLTNNYGSDPGIATYSDGFYTASNVEAGKRPIHTERIEVLRGPQGTLYGRNSIGGALNVISKRPTDTFEGEVRATVGNYDTQIFEGSLSGPITDWLRFRFAGNTGGQGTGFFRDEDSSETEGGVADDLYVEGQLEFNFGDNFDGWFKYAHSEWNQARRTLAQITPDDLAPVYYGGLFPNTTYNGPQVATTTRPPPPSRRPRTSHQSVVDGPAHLQHGHAVPDQSRRRRHLHAGAGRALRLGRPQVRRRLPRLYVHAGLRLRHDPARTLYGARRHQPADHGVSADRGVLHGGQGVLQQRDQPDLHSRRSAAMDRRPVSVSRAGESAFGRARAAAG